MDFIQLGSSTSTSSFKQLRGGVQLSGADAQLWGDSWHSPLLARQLWNLEVRAGPGPLPKHKGWWHREEKMKKQLCTWWFDRGGQEV